MKRQLLISAILLLAMLSACKKGDKDIPAPVNPPTGITPNQSFTISDFTPKTAKVGETINITWAAYNIELSTVTLKFGASASVKPKTITSDKMTVDVPSDAQTGKIQITGNGAYGTNGITVSSADNFTLAQAGPTTTITNFAPKTFSEGQTVTITGTNFGNSVDDVLVYLRDNVGFKPVSVTPTTITAVIPYDAEIGMTLTKPLKISIKGTTVASSTDNFTYQLLVKPESVAPASARAGEIVKIYVLANRVRFGLTIGDLNALTFNFGSSAAVKGLTAKDGYVSVRVPSGATTGDVKVSYTGFATGTSASSFTVLPPLPAVLSGTWTKRPDFPNITGAGAFAFTIGTKAYVGGGSFSAGPLDGLGITSAVWEYDQTYDSWMQVADYGGGKRTSSVAFAIGNKGYVGTGYTEDGTTATNDFWEYDPSDNSWSKKANFMGTSRAEAVGFSIGSKGYIGSGSSTNATSTFNDFYEYTPSSNTWKQVASITGNRTEAYAFVTDGKTYVGGGNLNGKADLTMYMFDPAANTWSLKASIPSYNNVSSNTSFAINGKGYVGLGYTVPGSFTVGTKKMFSYTPSTNTWQSVPDYGGAARYAPTAFVISDIAYVGLGYADAGLSKYKDFWAFKP